MRLSLPFTALILSTAVTAAPRRSDKFQNVFVGVSRYLEHPAIDDSCWAAGVYEKHCMVNGVNQCCEPLDCVELGNNPACPGITRYFCMETKSPVGGNEMVEAAGHAVVRLDAVVA